MGIRPHFHVGALDPCIAFSQLCSRVGSTNAERKELHLQHAGHCLILLKTSNQVRPVLLSPVSLHHVLRHGMDSINVFKAGVLEPYETRLRCFPVPPPPLQANNRLGRWSLSHEINSAATPVSSLANGHVGSGA